MRKHQCNVHAKNRMAPFVWMKKVRGTISSDGAPLLNRSDQIYGQTEYGEALFLGFGAITAKSFELFFVSKHPLLLRIAAVVALRSDTGRTYEQLVEEPYPIKSTTVGWPVGHVSEGSIVVELTSATFPADKPIEKLLPVASGVGNSAPPVPANPCCIR